MDPVQPNRDLCCFTHATEHVRRSHSGHLYFFTDWHIQHIGSSGLLFSGVPSNDPKLSISKSPFETFTFGLYSTLTSCFTNPPFISPSDELPSYSTKLFINIS